MAHIWHVYAVGHLSMGELGEEEANPAPYPVGQL